MGCMVNDKSKTLKIDSESYVRIFKFRTYNKFHIEKIYLQIISWICFNIRHLSILEWDILVFCVKVGQRIRNNIRSLNKEIYYEYISLLINRKTLWPIRGHVNPQLELYIINTLIYISFCVISNSLSFEFWSNNSLFR